MKYIRTTQGIFEYKDNMTIDYAIYYLFGKFEKTNKKHLFRNDKDLGEVVNQADTVEELCDGFIFKDTCTNKLHLADLNDGISMLGVALFEETLRGFIETDKGLIYVAKMNEKGELELI